MSTITDLFQQSQLAEAAYANFIDDSGNLLTTTDGVRKALIDSGFSKGPDGQSTQATVFVAEWQVVDQYTAPSFLGITGTGFSATLSKNIKVGSPDFGKYTLAMRGTAGLVDLSADAGDVLADGAKGGSFGFDLNCHATAHRHQAGRAAWQAKKRADAVEGAIGERNGRSD